MPTGLRPLLSPSPPAAPGPPPPGSMASAFQRVVKSVVQELDDRRELEPVDSLRSSSSFQPYCLLGRRPPSSWFWRPRYTGINLSLRDILEPSDPEPGTAGRRPPAAPSLPAAVGSGVPVPRGGEGVGGAGGGASARSPSSRPGHRSLPIPRRSGWAGAGPRGTDGGPRAGRVLGRGRRVRQLQRLHERVHAASGPQQLGHAPGEVSPQNPT